MAEYEAGTYGERIANIYDAIYEGQWDSDQAAIEVTTHDPVNQRLVSQHVVLSEHGIQLYPARLRYTWPSELDLIAQLAGLRLRDRWGSWRRELFTVASTSYVSVYEHPEAP